jgi:uncharacterized protein YigA (DUF484 family)
MSLNPLDVVAYLEAHPEFFQDHTEVLNRISLISPHGNRAVSLQERQMEMLRDKIKNLELRTAELIRFGQENDAITEKTIELARKLFLERNAMVLPDALVVALKEIYSLPAVAVRVWGATLGTDQPYARSVSPDTRLFANSLTAPYVGSNSGFEAALWLTETERVASLAILPLRVGAAPEAYGLVVMGSPDPKRFTRDMGTTYLARIGEIASAALARLVQ